MNEVRDFVCNSLDHNGPGSCSNPDCFNHDPPHPRWEEFQDEVDELWDKIQGVPADPRLVRAIFGDGPSPDAMGGYLDSTGQTLAEIDANGDVIPGRGDPRIEAALQQVAESNEYEVEESEEWLSPFQYAKGHMLRPQLVYYFIRSRGAPHRVTNGKLEVERHEFDNWFTEYMVDKEKRRTSTKHVHGPDCVHGEIIPQKPQGAPKTAAEFAYLEGKQRQKKGARTGMREAVKEFEGLMNFIDSIPDGE